MYVRTKFLLEIRCFLGYTKRQIQEKIGDFLLLYRAIFYFYLIQNKFYIQPKLAQIYIPYIRIDVQKLKTTI